jgi:hypothetical protein
LTAINFKLASGSNPYLYFGSDATPTYADTGAFLGIVSSTPKFSLVSGALGTDGFLKYDPSATYDLEIGGNAKIGPLNLFNQNLEPSFTPAGSSGDSLSWTTTQPNITRTYNLKNPLSLVSVKEFNVSIQLSAGPVTAYFIVTATAIKSSKTVYQEQRTFTILSPAVFGSDSYTFNFNGIVCDQIQVTINQLFISSSGTATIGSFKELFPILELDETLKIFDKGGILAEKLQLNNTTFGSNYLTVNGDYDLLLTGTSKNFFISSDTFDITKGFSFINGLPIPEQARLKLPTLFLNNSNLTKDGILIDPLNLGDTSARISITTPSSGITGSKTITLPNATGTVALMQRSTATMYIGRIWTRSYNNQTWTLRRDATLQILPTDGTYQVFNLGYTIVDDSANADVIKVEIVGGTNSTSSGRAFVEVVAGTFQTTSGIAVLSYMAFDGVNGNIITPIQYLAQYRTNGTNFEVRRPTSIKMSGGA